MRARTTTTAGTRIDWLLFVTLGFFWGSSYLFIKIGVDAGLQPFTLVALRLLVGFLLLAAVAAVARERLPRAAAHVRPPRGHRGVQRRAAVLPHHVGGAERRLHARLGHHGRGTAVRHRHRGGRAARRADDRAQGRRAGIGFVGIAVLVGFDPAVLSSTGLVPVAALMGSTISYAIGRRLCAPLPGWRAADDAGAGRGGHRAADGRAAGAHLRPGRGAADGPPDALVRGAVAGHARLRPGVPHLLPAARPMGSDADHARVVCHPYLGLAWARPCSTSRWMAA